MPLFVSSKGQPLGFSAESLGKTHTVLDFPLDVSPMRA